MNPDFSEEYFAKYLSREISDQEKSELVDNLKSNPDKIKELADFTKIWNIAGLGSDEEEAGIAFQQIITNRVREQIKNRTKSVISNTIKIAASVVILFSLTFSFITIKKLDSKEQTINYITTYVPYGEKGQVTLSDGTVVWLNSGTTLKYPTNYDGENRQVFLEGEGYFDVKKDPEHPFLVHAGGLNIKALGTEFNVTCYNEDDEINTTLIEGEVRIVGSSEILLKKEINLKPNESANFSKNKNKVTLTKVQEQEILPIEENLGLKPVSDDLKKIEKIVPHIESITSWKYNQLIFDHETLPEMVKKMERWYGLKIILKGDINNNDIYSGKFIYNEPIDQVLDILSRTTNIKYDIKKKIVTIWFSE